MISQIISNVKAERYWKELIYLKDVFIPIGIHTFFFLFRRAHQIRCYCGLPSNP